MQSARSVGFMPIPIGHGRMIAVEGGPFYAFSGEGVGLCLEERFKEKATISIDVPDFSTPKPEELDDALAQMVDAMYAGTPTYIGCMAGQGRSGLAMACLAKSFGIDEPIKHVRRWYTPHAVETSGQKAFVESVTLPQTLAAIERNRKLIEPKPTVIVVEPKLAKPVSWRARLKKSLPWLWIK